MNLLEDYRRRQQIIKEIVKNIELYEDEIKSEIEKVKKSETTLRDQQLDYYLLYLWTIFGGDIIEVKDKIAESDKLLQELGEVGKAELQKRGMLPPAYS